MGSCCSLYNQIIIKCIFNKYYILKKILLISFKELLIYKECYYERKIKRIKCLFINIKLDCLQFLYFCGFFFI